MTAANRDRRRSTADTRFLTGLTSLVDKENRPRRDGSAMNSVTYK